MNSVVRLNSVEKLCFDIFSTIMFPYICKQLVEYLRQKLVYIKNVKVKVEFSGV